MKYKVTHISESGTYSDNEFIGIYNSIELAEEAKKNYIQKITMSEDNLQELLNNGEIDQFEFDDHLEEFSKIGKFVVIENV